MVGAVESAGILASPSGGRSSRKVNRKCLMSETPYDLFVIGGGVNGCGIARDAAGRGYSVYLAEMDDLASGTSSAATKLIHGGLRYLEHYEFRLVRESLQEREIIWSMAPHIVWPLRFILPHHKGLRPRWMLRAGLLLYDHIGGRKKLPATRTLDLHKDPTGKPLQAIYRTGFEYSDCWANDARLVVLNARDAADRGASINTRTKVTGARRGGGLWHVDILHVDDGKTETVTARMLVNAAGPWADTVLAGMEGRSADHHVRLVKGSHIVVRRHYEHDKCYIFQNADGRIIFAIPYENDFTLIGTTDRDYEGDPSDVAISSDEINYLCTAASEYFAHPVERSQVVWAYSGVRPLYDDGATSAQETTRDYVMKLDEKSGEAPLLNIFGGKLTTFRRLSEEALDHVGAAIGVKGAPWTAGSTLPGGNFGTDEIAAIVERLKRDYPFLMPAHARRLVRLYGTCAWDLLGETDGLAALGEQFGADLTAREVDYLIEAEWARTVDDILWRRTKLGLQVSERDTRALQAYLEKRQKKRTRISQGGTS